ncbi:MAG: hypothetical protein Q9213_004895 [Squamulea squamosa]
MDGISGPASILAIAAAGVQISIKLISFSNQVSNGQEQIRYIGTDVSMTAGILQQFGELMQKSPGDADERTTIFSQEGLTTTQTAADACQAVFRALEEALRKASGQLRRKTIVPGQMIILSKTESLRWPFLQPNFNVLRQELNNSRATLMLILQITTLAYSKKMAELLVYDPSSTNSIPLTIFLSSNSSTMSREEQEIFIKSIISQHRTEKQQPRQELLPFDHAGYRPQGTPFPPDLRRSPISPNLNLMAIPKDTPEERTRTDTSDVDYPDLETERLRGDPDSRSFKKKRSEIGSDTPPWRSGRNSNRPFNDGKTSPSLLNHLIPVSEARDDVNAWAMWPVIHPVYCGYDMRWSFKHLPTPMDQAHQTMQSLHPDTRVAVEEQLERISAKEREFLKAFVQGRLPSGSGVDEVNAVHQPQHVDILNVIVKQSQTTNGGFGEIGNRRITFITQVDRSQLMPLRTQPRPASNLDPSHAIEANTNNITQSLDYNLRDALRKALRKAASCTYDYHPQEQHLRLGLAVNSPSPPSPETSPKSSIASLDTESEEPLSKIYGQEGMTIVEEYLAKYTTL